MKTFKSETLDFKTMILLNILSSSFIALFLFVLINALFSGNDEWMIISDLWILNVLALIIISVVLSGWYFYKDWMQYRDQSVTFQEKSLKFESQYTKTQYYDYHELMSYIIIKTLYGFRRYRKVLLFFRSKKTSQKIKKTMLLKDYQSEDLIKALKAHNKRVTKA